MDPVNPRESGKALAKALLVLGSLIVLPAWIEALVVTTGVAPDRASPLMVWNPEQDADLKSSEGEFRAHSRWLWEPRPGATVHGDTINEGGFRGPYYKKERGTALRIATLGDSSTYGFGVPEPSCWSRSLETFLRENGVEVEVLNFGVVGYTIRQGLELYRGRVREYQPDIVIIAFGAVNDSVSVPAGLTDGDKIARLTDPRLRLMVFLRRYATFRWMESAFSSGTENRAGVTGPKGVGGADPSVLRVPPDDFRASIRALDAETRADGAQLVVVIPPRRPDAEGAVVASTQYPLIAMETATSAGVPVADVYRPFRAMDEKELAPDPVKRAGQSRLFIDPWHPSEVGHAAYAKVVALALHAAGLIKAPAQKGD